MWRKIVGTIAVRTVAVIGDAIRVPTIICTIISIMTYEDAKVHEHIAGRSWTRSSAPEKESYRSY